MGLFRCLISKDCYMKIDNEEIYNILNSQQEKFMEKLDLIFSFVVAAMFIFFLYESLSA